MYVSEDMRSSVFYYPVLVLSVVPYCVGIVFMVVYYGFLHPKVRMGRSLSVSFKASGPIADVS